MTHSFDRTLFDLNAALVAAGKPDYYTNHFKDWECVVCADIPERPVDAQRSAPNAPPEDWEYATFGCGCNVTLCGVHCTSLHARGDSCPSCRRGGATTANGHTLKAQDKESLWQLSKCECAFKGEGCTFEGMPHEMVKHLKTCEHLYTTCPMHGQGCLWRGRRTDLKTHLQHEEHNQYLAAYVAESVKTQKALASDISSLRDEMGETKQAMTGMKTALDTFLGEFGDYLGRSGKRSKHASPDAPDEECGSSTVNERKRQRIWWGLDVNDFEGWLAQKSLRRDRGNVQMQPPYGWTRSSEERAEPLRPSTPMHDGF